MESIDYKKLAEKLSDWIREAVTSAEFDKVIIGVSGGIDSAVSASLAKKALGKDNVYPVMLPYGKLHSESVTDAKLLIDSLGIPSKNVLHINIKEAVDAICKSADIKQDNLRMGNIMARVRMIYLFDLSKKLGTLVCGTENKSEHYLGYFTRFGDEASDLEPIKSLYKTQVLEVAKVLKIPSKLINKQPTAGLWENQTDEGEFGFSYKEADQILSYYFDEKLTSEEIIKKGISKEIMVKVLERVAKNDFKHHLPLAYI